MFEFSDHLSDEDGSAIDRLSPAIVLAKRSSKTLPKETSLKQEVFTPLSSLT